MGTTVFISTVPAASDGEDAEFRTTDAVARQKLVFGLAQR